MNKVILTGTVGKFGNEVKAYGQSKGGKQNLLANFQVCVRTGYGDMASFGYYNCTKFNVSDKFKLEEGQHISIVGSLKQNIWKDKNGTDHYDVGIVVNEIEFLPNFPKKETPVNNGQSRGYYGR